MMFKFKASIAAVMAAGLLAGCSTTETETSDAPVPKDQAVVVATAVFGSSGAHAVFDAKAPFEGSDGYAPTGTDLVVASHGSSIYRIERYQADHITKFDISSPGTPVWQYSVLDAGEASANPQDMIFASEAKAYVPRLGSPNVWVVDPSAASDASFKTGSLDLSAYDDGDGTPEPAGGVIVGNKLFLMLQRLDRNPTSWNPQQAYLAVFDINTDTEIDTGVGGVLKGLPLQVKNPQSISYDSASGLIYVVAVGRYSAWDGSSATEYTGGIESIDPDDYSTDLILDDGDDTNHPIGQFSDMAIVSASKGYVVGYAGWGDNGLYEFNPTTGAFVTNASGDPQLVDNISGVNIGGLGVDADNKLWVSIQDASAPGLRVIDTSDNSVIEQRVATTLNPMGITFADAAE